MGAEGGIVGIKVRTPSEISYKRLRQIIPGPFLTWDDYRSDEEMERALFLAPKDCVWSTYGSFQDWDLRDLPGAVDEASEYATKVPDATFQDWVLDLYTGTWSDGKDRFWRASGDSCGTMSELLLDVFLGCGREVKGSTPQEPALDQDRLFLEMKVRDWVQKVRECLDLGDVWVEETWT